MTSFPSIWEEALRWHCLFGGWVPVGNGTDSLPFLQELVSKLLHLHFRDCKTKVSGDALQLMAELLRIFVLEAAARGVCQAQAEDLDVVDVDQLEKVLPQLLLDF
ncbi:Centromere protein X [Cricetulus griseus]|nr:Centromere protein X [Cricetulus griseus]